MSLRPLVISRLLTTVLLVTLVGASLSGDSCKDTRHGVDSGLVRVPDFQDNGVPPNVTCTWSFTAPPAKKLLVKVDSVHFPPQDLRDTSLKLILDQEVIDIPRNCVRCLKQIVSGHSVQIIYSSTLIWGENFDTSDTESETNPAKIDINRENENTLYSDAGSFQIRYKAFDPLICDKPRSPLNGAAIYTGRKLGQSVQYQCNPPYDLFGKNSALCQITDTPVPEWSNGPPKCGVSNCSNGPITRPVLSEQAPGAIASPGYPNFKIHSNFDCEWVITAEPGYQISAFLSYLELGDIGSLRLYDGIHEKILLNSSLLRNVTTRTNVLTVSFATNNTGLAEGGFYLGYSAVPGSCPPPAIPDNGDVIGYSFLVGSNVAFRCNEGYNLLGANQARCDVNGQWTNPSPTCLNLNLTSNILESTTANKSKRIPSINITYNYDIFETTTEIEPTLIPTTLTPKFALTAKIVNSLSSNSDNLETTTVTSPTLTSTSSTDLLSSKVTESSNNFLNELIPSNNATSNSSTSGAVASTATSDINYSPTTFSPTTMGDMSLTSKVTKSSKKSKFVPSTKIAAKSTAKPKLKPEVVSSGNGNDAVTTTTTTTGSVLVNETVRDNFKDGKVSRTENGLLDKTKSEKNSNDKVDDKTYAKASEDYLEGEIDVIDDSDLEIRQSGAAKHAPPMSAAPPVPSEGNSVTEVPGDKEGDVSLMTTYVGIGVGAGLIVVLFGVIVTLIVYRKRFPVRMRFGRKFSTFENPMYVANKDQDAQHPRELKRLTV